MVACHVTSHDGHVTSRWSHVMWHPTMVTWHHDGRMSRDIPRWSHDITMITWHDIPRWSRDITMVTWHDIPWWSHDIAGLPHLVCAFCTTVRKRVIHLTVETTRYRNNTTWLQAHSDWTQTIMATPSHMTSWPHPPCSPDPQSSQRELHTAPWPLNLERLWPSEEGK